MHHYSIASLIVLGLFLSALGSARAAEPDSTAADEQTLKAANLGTDGPALLDFFRKRTPTEANVKRITLLIKQLGDDSFAVREKASAELVSIGPRPSRCCGRHSRTAMRKSSAAPRVPAPGGNRMTLPWCWPLPG